MWLVSNCVNPHNLNDLALPPMWFVAPPKRRRAPETATDVLNPRRGAQHWPGAGSVGFAFCFLGFVGGFSVARLLRRFRLFLSVWIALSFVSAARPFRWFRLFLVVRVVRVGFWSSDRCSGCLLFLFAQAASVSAAARCGGFV